jgi:m7GpppX diphosphatase
LDGIAEQDAILYCDKHVIVIPNYSWNGKDIEKMHILTFPTDKLLRSIRDLTANHIELLQYCKEKTIETIKKTYGFNEQMIKMYFHYSPSTYHLHIHSVLTSNTDCNSSVEYSHELSNVIFNLSLKSDYYQLAIMNKRI